MTKKLFALALALVCLAGWACAETRERVIMLEGQEETLTETRCAGPGFSFWYDASWLEIGEAPEGGGCLLLRPLGSQGADDIWLEILTPEAVGVLPWQFLDNHAYDGTAYLFEDLDIGTELVWFTCPYKQDPDLVSGVYVVREEEGGRWVAAIAVWPIEAGDGAGKRFTELMRTVAFGDVSQDGAAAPADGGMPVRALWAEDNTDTATTYLSWNLMGSESWVLFTAEEEVSDFRILELTLQFTGDGDYTYHEAEVFTLDSLRPVQPLIAGLDFPGDMPCWGIAYRDAQGAEHRCTVEISGENGAILLTEY